jgi:hypothetical protein
MPSVPGSSLEAIEQRLSCQDEKLTRAMQSIDRLASVLGSLDRKLDRLAKLGERE